MSESVWGSAEFHAQVRAWAATQVESHGASLTGALDQPHLRPWSSAIRLGTTAGPVWFKVNGAGTHHEPALLTLLADRVPALAPEVLAVDRDRAWSLCRDAGPVLRQVLPAERSWEAWEAVAARYGAAQLALAEHREELLATGITEVSPRTVPGLARTLLDELAALPVDAGGLDAGQAARLCGVLPALDAWCEELAASPVPDSLQHDDLHSGNVCWTGSARAGPGDRLGRRHLGLPARLHAHHDELGGLPRRPVRRGAAGRPPGGAAGPGRLPGAVHRPRRPRASWCATSTSRGVPGASGRRSPTGRRCGTRRSRRTPRSASRCATGCWACSTPRCTRQGALLPAGGGADQADVPLGEDHLLALRDPHAGDHLDRAAGAVQAAQVGGGRSRRLRCLAGLARPCRASPPCRAHRPCRRPRPGRPAPRRRERRSDRSRPEDPAAVCASR